MADAPKPLTVSRYPRIELAQNQLATADLLRAIVRRMPAPELLQFAKEISEGWIDRGSRDRSLAQSLMSWGEPRPGELERKEPELEHTEDPPPPADTDPPAPNGAPAPALIGPPLVDPVLAADWNPEQ